MHDDPVGQGSPFRMQVDSARGILVAVASARDERMSRPMDCILTREVVQGILSRLEASMTLECDKWREYRVKIYILSAWRYFGECNIKPSAQVTHYSGYQSSALFMKPRYIVRVRSRIFCQPV